MSELQRTSRQYVRVHKLRNNKELRIYRVARYFVAEYDPETELDNELSTHTGDYDAAAEVFNEIIDKDAPQDENPNRDSTEREGVPPSIFS